MKFDVLLIFRVFLNTNNDKTTAAFRFLLEYFLYCVIKVILQLFNIFILKLFLLSDQNNTDFFTI